MAMNTAENSALATGPTNGDRWGEGGYVMIKLKIFFRDCEMD